MTSDPEVPLRRDRDGELVPDRRDAPREHRCRRGWLEPRPDGTPVPCLTCKPHLVPRRLSTLPDLEANARGRELVRQALAEAGARTRQDADP